MYAESHEAVDCRILLKIKKNVKQLDATIANVLKYIKK